MNKYEGLCCPICKSKLFEDDDIAVCPDCGAPHHRECFIAAGSCGYAADHGTENEWRLPEPEPEPEQEQDEAAPEQLSPDSLPFESAQRQGPNPFAYADNLDKSDRIDDERTTDIASFVGFNAPRYVEIFRKMSYTKSKTSWNWLAFLLPEYWFFSRKCYRFGTIAAAVTLAMRVVMIMLISTGGALYNYLANPNYDVSAFIDSPDLTMMLAIGGVLLIWRVFTALFGDYIYKRKVFSTIKLLRSAGSTDRLTLFRNGGVNVLLPLVVMLVLEIVTTVISIIIG